MPFFALLVEVGPRESPRPGEYIHGPSKWKAAGLKRETVKLKLGFISSLMNKKRQVEKWPWNGSTRKRGEFFDLRQISHQRVTQSACVS